MAKLGLRSVEDTLFGAVTFIQRADSSLRLNVHFHCLVLDGQPALASCYGASVADRQLLGDAPRSTPVGVAASEGVHGRHHDLPRYRGGMRLVEIANEPDDIARVLADLGLGPRPPPRPRSAPAGQLELDFAA